MAQLQTINSSVPESVVPALGPVLVAGLRAGSRVAAAVVILISCSVLAGWVFEIDEVKRILPGLGERLKQIVEKHRT